MKKILPIFLAFLILSCGAKKHKEEENAALVSVAYKAMTRGTQKEILITSNSYTDVTVRRGEEIKGKGSVMPEQWKAIVTEASTLDYSNLKNIPAPSVKHQFDGALAANIIITTADSTYQSVTFDHGNPPARLKPLINAMAEISGSINN